MCEIHTKSTTQSDFCNVTEFHFVIIRLLWVGGYQLPSRGLVYRKGLIATILETHPPHPTGSNLCDGWFRVFHNDRIGYPQEVSDHR